MITNNPALLFFLQFILVLLLQNCTVSDQSNGDLSKDGGIKVQYVDFESVSKDKVDLEQIVDVITIVPLETNSESFLSKINKVKNVDDQYYVLDDANDNLLVFDGQGHYTGKIGKKGEGPGEYLDISDFAVDYSKKEILILSVEKRRILRYSLSGDFIDDIELPFQSFRIAWIDADMTAHNVSYYDEEKTNLKIIDGDGNIQASYFEFPEDTSPLNLLEITGNITENSSGILYSDATSSNIYQLTKNGDVYLKYQIVFEGTTWGEERRFESKIFFEEITQGKLHFLSKSYEETDDAFVFTYNYPIPGGPIVNLHNGYYIKGNGAFYNHKNLKDGLLKSLLSPPLGITQDGHFISLISPADYLAQRDNSLHYSFKNKLPKELDLEDNPLLVIYSVRY